jgi:hypothetical protein
MPSALDSFCFGPAPPDRRPTQIARQHGASLSGASAAPAVIARLPKPAERHPSASHLVSIRCQIWIPRAAVQGQPIHTTPALSKISARPPEEFVDRHSCRGTVAFDPST